MQGRSTREKQSFRLGVRVSLGEEVWSAGPPECARVHRKERERVQRPGKTAAGPWDSQSWVPRIQEE